MPPADQSAADDVDVPALELSASLPPVADTDDALTEVVASVAAGSGPIAIDAERASGYRYSSRAYLLQLRRAGSGTALIDPIPFGELPTLGAVIGDEEWVLHAATQDLPCLAQLGLRPVSLFDTELGGRLLNLPRVGLASLVQELIGRSLAKEHSAVDWSTRPLPEPWLLYAALDVEVLLELRDLVEARLTDAGKLQWAQQEFAALTRFAGPPARTEPWRRTSGIHRARGRRSLGVVRELWEARDQLAADLDVAPGRLLTDSAIVEIATTLPATRASLRSLPTVRHRNARRHLDGWEEALDRGRALSEDALPTLGQRYDGPPPARAWAEKDPVAAARLAACRQGVSEVAADHDLPVENLLAPDAVRRLAWEPPAPLDHAAVAAALEGYGARPWQVQLTAGVLTAALDDTAD
ncbi:MAG: HRDC domain-containing protein [Nocardioidaceae bacterium]